MEATLRATVKKLLHPPMAHLRGAAAGGNEHQEVEAIRTLFGLDGAPHHVRDRSGTGAGNRQDLSGEYRE